MLKKTLTAAVLALALATGGAFAQSTATTPSAATTSPSATSSSTAPATDTTTPPAKKKSSKHAKATSTDTAPAAATTPAATTPAAAAPSAAATSTPAKSTPAKAAPKTTATTLAPGTKVNVNTATEEQLDALPQVGKPRAKVIMTERAKAPFKDWADFDTRTAHTSVNAGVKAKIKDYVTF